jgi:hypothetical protein
VVGGEVVGGDVVVADDVVADWLAAVPAVVAKTVVVVVIGAVDVDDELQLAAVKQAANMTGRHPRKTMALRLGRNPQTREVAPVVFVPPWLTTGRAFIASRNWASGIGRPKW